MSGYVDLLAEILRDLPRMDGALCSGRADEWTLLPLKDPQREPQAARAIAECKRCPALQLCTHQLDVCSTLSRRLVSEWLDIRMGEV